MHRKCAPHTVSRQQSLTVWTHKLELCSITKILDEVRNNFLILIIALRASKVDEPLLSLPSRDSQNAPAVICMPSWLKLGEGLVVHGPQLIGHRSSRGPIRQSSSSSSSRAGITGSKPLELGIELSLNFLELAVSIVI